MKKSLLFVMLLSMVFIAACSNDVVKPACTTCNCLTWNQVSAAAMVQPVNAIVHSQIEQQFYRVLAGGQTMLCITNPSLGIKPIPSLAVGSIYPVTSYDIWYTGTSMPTYQAADTTSLQSGKCLVELEFNGVTRTPVQQFIPYSVLKTGAGRWTVGRNAFAYSSSQVPTLQGIAETGVILTYTLGQRRGGVLAASSVGTPSPNQFVWLVEP